MRLNWVCRHKETGRKIIVRHIKDGADVYEKMLELKCDNLPIIYEVVQGDVGAIVMEEYISGMTIGDVLQSGLYTENGVREISKLQKEGLIKTNRNHFELTVCNDTDSGIKM